MTEREALIIQMEIQLAIAKAKRVLGVSNDPSILGVYDEIELIEQAIREEKQKRLNENT